LSHTLDTLAHLGSGELEALFAAGGRTELAALNGHPAGRMLAVPGLSAAPVGAALRVLAASPSFVWEGKSFSCAPGAERGRGANRVRALGRRMAFPFQTLATSSLVDGRPCLAISYDVPEGPALARATYDELRLVSDGLYLGRGMYKRERGAPLLLVWFALDVGHADAPLAFPAASGSSR
jgi:hypothetical protein